MLLTFDNRGGIRMRIVQDRLTKEDVAEHLQTSADGVAYLVKKRVLRPCGKPNGTKKLFFPTKYTLEQFEDPRVLDRITNALYQYSEEKHNKSTAKEAPAAKGSSL
jgi:hypothetical protein